MRVKLTLAGAARVVDAPDDASVAALAAIAATAFSVDVSRVSLYSTAPSAPLAAVRGGAVVEVRVAPPVTRHSVPADNSCVFSAVSWALSLGAAPAALRAACAAAVAADAAQWSDAVLGRPRGEYEAFITNPKTWGGGVELAVLAAEHGVELAAVEVRSGTLYVFGEGAGFAKRAYLVFDGMHYDACARGAERTFDAADERARADVAAFAAAERRAGAFADLSGFTLRCVDCAAGVVGEAGAVVHARETAAAGGTAHTNYAEYKV